MKFWFRTLSGSPDKLSQEALLISCIGPLILGTIYWTLELPLGAGAKIFLFIIFWYLLLVTTVAASKWYTARDETLVPRDRKRKKRAEFLFMQVVLLSVPAFLLFLSVLYYWFPPAGWVIVVFSIFGLIYIIGTLSSLYSEKK